MPVYNWSSFFAPLFRKLPAIKKFHHFRMTSTKPGTMYYKEHSDSPEESFDVLKVPWSTDSSVLPEVVPPRGLTPERQWYLFEQIRPFCPDADKDVTCPKPTVPKKLLRVASAPAKGFDLVAQTLWRFITISLPHSLSHTHTHLLTLLPILITKAIACTVF